MISIFPRRHGTLNHLHHAKTRHVKLHRLNQLPPSPSPCPTRLTLSYCVRHASDFIGFENELHDSGSSLERDPRVRKQLDRPSTTSTWSFKEWDTQSSVNTHNTPDSVLPVDKVNQQGSIKLWTDMLVFRKRVHGHVGVKDIFYGMRTRAVTVPTVGKAAAFLWTNFLDVAANDTRFREDLWTLAAEQARVTNHWWSGFYVGLMKPVLIGEPRKAPDWARRLRTSKPSFTTRGSLKQLIDPALSSSEALSTFKLIFIRHVDRDVYGIMIAKLCDCGLFKDALNYHHFFLKHGSLPQTTSELEVLAKHVALFSDQATFDDFRKSLAKINQSLTAPLSTIRQARPRETEDKFVDDGGDEESVRPRSIGDATAARAFATTALSVNFIITGLISFGLRVLGVTAMRELAVRCENVDQLAEYIDRLKREHVVIEDRVYNKLMQRLAGQRDHSMFQAVLQSDLHPEVYDDRNLQLRLLEQYKRQRDWYQLYRTLTVLTTLYQNPSEQAWNLLLRGFMIEKSWRMIDNIVEDMLSQCITVTEQTINKSFFMLLRARNPGKAPEGRIDKDGIDDLTFLTRMWLKILKAGQFVPFYSWRQPLTYYGMSGRMEELESLSLELAKYYSEHRASKTAQSAIASNLTKDTVIEKNQTLHRIQRFRLRDSSQLGLQSVFTPAKQRAIVAWGFKTLGKDVPKRRRVSTSYGLNVVRSNAVVTQKDASFVEDSYLTQWDRGLRLLVRLQKLGLAVDTGLVRNTVRQRLQVLFHPRYVTRVAENRIAREQVPLSLTAMVKHINRVVGRNLLGVPLGLLQDEDPSTQLALAHVVLEPKGYTRRIRKLQGSVMDRPRELKDEEKSSNETFVNPKADFTD